MSTQSPAPAWFDTAHAATLLAMDAETLNGYLDKPHPEKLFQPLGLLFDRQRHEQGEPYLQLLVPAYDDSDRQYQWHDALIRIQINFQPARSPDDDRFCLVSATTYDDFPLHALIQESELGEIPEAVQALLDKLKDELPVRRLRYNAKTAKTGKKKPATHIATTSAPLPAPAATAAHSTGKDKGAKPNPGSGETQISIFGI